jgi:pimeloyl-ACP methyl ester carboxylesterase
MTYRYLAGVALSLWSLAGTAQEAQSAQVSPDYALAVFANHALDASAAPDPGIERAVVMVHGVRRNAEDYFTTGEQLLATAHWPDTHTLLLAPGFFTARDRPAGANLPLWDSRWMQGRPSVQGRVGITPLRALDDLLAWVGDGKRYPALKQIVLIGHSAGGQLVQRYAVFSSAEQKLAAQGIALRYVISSPSSYLYFDDRRPMGAQFNQDAVAHCPEVNHYRYGLEGLPSGLNEQASSARELFKQYASKPVTYLVGEQDNDPNHRLLDKSCAAEAQGRTRLERQRQYLAYEQLLSHEWRIPVNHAQAQVPGTGHDARALYTSPVAIKLLEANPPR